jgi:hypothetical protein
MKLFSRLLLLILLASCYGSAPEPKFNTALVLPADSMVSLLTDFHLAEGEVNVLKNKEHPAGHLSSEYFDAILKKHSLSREEFEESMRYYAFHTEELDKIYEKIITDLSKKESLARPSKEAEKPAE